jgi:CBS domain-containing protein
MSTILKFKEVREVFFSKPALSCKEQDKVRDVVHKMNEKGTGSIVITDSEGKALGIFTERDYMTKSLAFDDMLDMDIKDMMTKNPKTVPESFRLDVAVGIMRLGKFRHLVVVEDESEKIVGVVSMRDFFNFFCDLIAEEL